ncbi:type II toxin-antitoxin system VapB family antitoxin [Pseudomonas sp. NY15435]|uniref:type II toxin-antitoxin system VapB family antitoxin n=1 Tax=Pseudomonas sp. NY15435 TaxID=3400358 RepID=UPI003A8AE1D5
MPTTTVSLFRNGKNQAVRIPRDMEFRGVTELVMTREGDTLTLRPSRPTWSSLAALKPIDADILGDRPAVIEPGRIDFSENEE